MVVQGERTAYPPLIVTIATSPAPMRALFGPRRAALAGEGLPYRRHPVDECAAGRV
jgi:hypothetical protein